MTATVLLYGRDDDPPMSRVLEAARDAAVPHVMVDQRHLHRYQLWLEAGPDGLRGELNVAGQRVALAEAHSVYARPLDLSPTWADPVGGRRAETFHRAFVEWLDYAPGLVLNRPAAMESNFAKPLQAQLIADCGLAVPATLATSDPAEVRRFWAHHGRVVYKSLSGIRSIVHELDEHSATRLPAIERLPTQFQAYVPGTDVRVHVVGDLTYATEVTSDAVDYRYAAVEGLTADLTPAELPPEVRDACLRVSRSLGLPLCGVDLRRRPDGRWVCFEVNPMPGHSYYEGHTGQPISAAIVALLTGHRGLRAEVAPWSRGGRTSAR